MQSETHANLVLASLHDPIRTLISCDLERVSFEPGTMLDVPGQTSEGLLFPEEGIIAVVAGHDPRLADVGLIGREAFTSTNIVYGDDKCALGAIARTKGWGFSIKAGRFKEALHQSELLRTKALLCAKALALQFAFTGSSASNALITQRLARLLLMLHDRHFEDQVAFTHHDLSGMLGTRRQSITASLHLLEGKGLVEANRKEIRIVNRPGLELASGGFYGAAEGEYERLLGVSIRKLQPARHIRAQTVKT